MNSIENAIDRIRILECPTGEVALRVADILEDYNIANRNDLEIYRDRQFDRNGAEAYTAFSNKSNQSIIFLAKSGMDDYVAKVVDAYIMT